MKKKEFKRLQVGDVVFLKNVEKIKQMDEWDGEYFRDSTGSLWCNFLVEPSALSENGVVVVRKDSYYPDAITVKDDNCFYEIPRKCLKKTI